MSVIICPIKLVGYNINYLESTYSISKHELDFKFVSNYDLESLGSIKLLLSTIATSCHHAIPCNIPCCQLRVDRRVRHSLAVNGEPIESSPSPSVEDPITEVWVWWSLKPSVPIEFEDLWKLSSYCVLRISKILCQLFEQKTVECLLKQFISQSTTTNQPIFTVATNSESKADDWSFSWWSSSTTILLVTLVRVRLFIDITRFY